MRNTLLIINHTHWDREWYRSYGDFRFRLLRGTEHVVKMFQQQNLEYFLFDGQTSVIEDLSLVANTALMHDLKNLIAEEKIQIGPWYISPDEFLIRGESLVRNLQTGIRYSQQFQTPSHVLYLPDSFGHISQLPQMAKLFDLHSIVLSRGIQEPCTNLWWKSEEGSCLHLHAIPLFSGYYNDFLHHDDYVEKTKEFVKNTRLHAKNLPIVLFAGADHTMPPSDVSHRIHILKNELSTFEEGWDIEETSLDEAMRRLRNSLIEAPVIEGELRDNRKSYLLSGINSSRMDLKILNGEAETLLIDILEPLTLFTAFSDGYPEHRKHLWKTLIQNHAHDSIGGCSTDEVHRENKSRFDQVISAATRQIKDMTRRMAGHNPYVFNDMVLVFNTIPRDRTIISELVITIPNDVDKGSLRLEQCSKKVPTEIISRRETDGFFSEFEYPPQWKDSVEYRVLAELTIPAMQASSYTIRAEYPSETLSKPSNIFRYSNEFLAFSVSQDGSVAIRNPEEAWIENCMELIAEPELGDSYTSSPSASISYSPIVLSVTDFRTSELAGSCTIEYAFEDGTTVSAKLELRKHDTFVRVSLLVINQSKNKRLRLLLGSKGAEKSSLADIPFDIVQREHRNEIFEEVVVQKESYPNEWPASSFVSAAKVSFFSKSNFGYDLHTDGRLSVILLRSVGMLSKGALLQRGGGAGPQVRTQEAQLIGTLHYDLALSTDQGSSAPLTSQLFRIPLISHQGTKCTITQPVCTLTDMQLIHQALYRFSDTSFLIRLLNTSSKAITSTVIFSPFSTVQKVDLLDRPLLDSWSCDETGMYKITCKSKEILSFIIQERSIST